MPDVDPDKSTTTSLKRLRESDESAPAATQPVRGNESSGVGKERRRHPRYKCAGSAELRKEGTTIRTWGTFTDISQSGCYVELQATFPPETKMDVVLELNNIRLHAKAVVRVSYPFLGMGLAFTEISEEDGARLAKLLDGIAVPCQPGTAALANPPQHNEKPRTTPDVLNAKAAIAAVLGHFDREDHLTREKFLSLLEASQSEFIR